MSESANEWIDRQHFSYMCHELLGFSAAYPGSSDTLVPHFALSLVAETRGPLKSLTSILSCMIHADVNQASVCGDPCCLHIVLVCLLPYYPICSLDPISFPLAPMEILAFSLYSHNSCIFICQHYWHYVHLPHFRENIPHYFHCFNRMKVSSFFHFNIFRFRVFEAFVSLCSASQQRALLLLFSH